MTTLKNEATKFTFVICHWLNAERIGEWERKRENVRQAEKDSLKRERDQERMRKKRERVRQSWRVDKEREKREGQTLKIASELEWMIRIEWQRNRKYRYTARCWEKTLTFILWGKKEIDNISAFEGANVFFNFSNLISKLWLGCPVSLFRTSSEKFD